MRPFTATTYVAERLTLPIATENKFRVAQRVAMKYAWNYAHKQKDKSMHLTENKSR